MITAQSSDGVLHQFPDGTDPAVVNGAMKNYAAANTAPPEEAPPPEDKSGFLAANAKAAGVGLINSVAGIGGGVGDIVSSAGSDLKTEAAQEDQRKATVLSVFDDMDDGLPIPKDIKDAQGNRLNNSLFSQYKFGNADQRSAIRAQITGQSKATNGLEATLGLDLQSVGTAETTGAHAVQDWSNGLMTDEERGRTSVKISSMIGGLVPVLGAAVAGDLPALIGVGGVQGYGEGFDAAKKAGQSDDAAATAGMLNGMVQGGLMAVPVHKALEVMDALPGLAKSSVLKAAVELAKSSGTMVGFSQLSTLADNAVAKATYDPNRDMMQGAGEDVGVQAAVGAFLPVAGAAAHVVTEAGRRLVTPDVKTAATADKVMAAPDIDTAIATATDAAQSAAPIIDAAVAGKDALDQVAQGAQQQKLNTLFSGLNTGTVEKSNDDTYNFHPTGEDANTAPFPLKVWDENAKPVEGEPQPSGDNIISPELAALQRQHYGDMGIDVVYFQNDARIPFDGAVDPEQPNTIFLSNDPTRNAAQVAGHEVTHVLENTQLPDGTNLGDLFHQQVAEGLNATGRNYAETVFGSTAPKRDAFDEGVEGDAAHKAAITQHLVQEIGADIGGEAPKFETFMPKVIDAVQQRYGKSVAGDVLQKFLDGIKSAMQTLRKFFGGGDGPAATQSQKWVDNLDAIHDTLAKMQAERFGTGIEREAALLAAQKDRAARDRLAAGQPETSLYNVEENKPITETPLSAPAEVAETAPASPVQTGGRDLGPDYAATKTRATTYRRWLGELDAKRRAEAANLPQVRLLRENESAILNRVNGVESRLTGAAADRLAAVREQIAAHTNPVGDNPAMARVRAAMVREHQKMADAASVTKGAQFSPKQQDEKPFFSALTRAVEDLKMEKATPGQWEATIQNMPGIKSEELAWSGLREWLAAQTKPVSKAEVLTHLRENEVQVLEVLKGHKLSAVPNEEETEYAGEPMVDVVDEKGHVFYTGDPEAAAEYIKEGTGGPKQTKFDSHVLPGGENYRELLMTLPPTINEVPSWKVIRPDGHVDMTFTTERSARDQARISGAGYTVQQGETIAARGGFKSSHFDEANILAHTRFDDRTGPDGQKILHVAEIQSDWHQAGRKRGYNSDYKSSLSVVQDAGGIWRVRDANGQRVDLDGQSGFGSESRAKTAISVHARKEGGVPDAPFKTSWHELAMKRILRYAAEHGYARVSWDTGATQADRYDLSKSVDSIDWYKTSTEKIHLEVKDKDGDVIFDKPVAPEGVADVIGKEHADRIAASDKTEGNFSGEGLKVGGEGMKGFYDKILPNFVNKYVKKWGGKVEDSKIGAKTETLDVVARDGSLIERTVFDSRAHRIARENPGSKVVQATEQFPTHSVEITPAMRESVMRGQPLFSPRVSEETRDKLIKRNRAYAEMFKTPRTSERKIEVPSKGADSELDDIPKPTFRTTPGAIAAEHAAEVSTLEAEGTKAAAEKKMPVEKTSVAEPVKAEIKKEVASEKDNSSVAEVASRPSATAAAPEEPKTRTLTTKHPEGKGETIERALNGEETKALENKDQMERASALVDKDPAKALRVVMRKEQPPKDLLPTFVYFELERRATKAGDMDMIEKLRTSPLAKEVTTAARTVQSFATRDPQSALANIQEVEQAREAAADTRAKNTGGLEAAKAAETAKAVPEVKKAVREQIKARPISDWASFLESITCGN